MAAGVPPPTYERAEIRAKRRTGARGDAATGSPDVVDLPADGPLPSDSGRTPNTGGIHREIDHTALERPVAVRHVNAVCRHPTVPSNPAHPCRSRPEDCCCSGRGPPSVWARDRTTTTFSSTNPFPGSTRKSLTSPPSRRMVWERSQGALPYNVPTKSALTKSRAAAGETTVMKRSAQWRG